MPLLIRRAHEESGAPRIRGVVSSNGLCLYWVTNSFCMACDMAEWIRDWLGILDDLHYMDPLYTRRISNQEEKIGTGPNCV